MIRARYQDEPVMMESTPPRVTTVIAAMNEEQGIGKTIEELQEHIDSKLIVVDGNSNDRTVQIAESLGAEILVQEGKGKGNAIFQGLKNLPPDSRYIVFTDADYTYPAEYIPQMIRILEDNPRAGMVCGNRFNSHLHISAMHSFFYFGNRIIAFTHNLLNGITLRDPLTGLRVVRAKLLKDWQPKSAGFDIEVEMNYHIEKQGYNILEIEIPYRPRLGEKKLKIKHGVTIMNRILSECLVQSISAPNIPRD